MTTLDEIIAMRDVVITPEVASKALGCRPQTIRIAARTAPERLGFPVQVMGHRIRIPRVPFIKFLTGGSYAEANSGAGGTG